MPVSNRHMRAASKQAPVVPDTSTYRITDPAHKPDMRGQFGGVKVQRSQDGKHQLVTMTNNQARFYLDSGAIEPHK